MENYIKHYKKVEGWGNNVSFTCSLLFIKFPFPYMHGMVVSLIQVGKMDSVPTH